MNRKNSTLLVTLLLITTLSHITIHSAAPENNAAAQPANQSPEQEQALFTAIGQNSLETVNALLPSLHSLEFRNNNDYTPLMYAASEGYHHEIIQALLHKKADVEARHPNGSGTALLLAIRNGYSRTMKYLVVAGDKVPIKASLPDNLDTLKLLIAHQASGAAQDKKGNNALMTAALNDNYHAADLLLNNATNTSARKHINDTNHKGRSALAIADNHTNDEMVRLLCVSGADHNAQTLEGTTLFEAATPEMQKIMQEAESLRIIELEKQRKKQAQAAFYTALAQQNLPALDEALTQGADINDLCPQHDLTPLARTAQQPGHPEMTQALLDRKANINARNTQGGTALMHAITNQSYEVLDLLLANKADVTRRGNSCPLRLAIDAENATLVQELIELSAEVNERFDPYNQTALQEAIELGEIEVVSLMVEAGADPHLADRRGFTPMSIAQDTKPHYYEAMQAALIKRQKHEDQKILADYHASVFTKVSPFAKATEDKSADTADTSPARALAKVEDEKENESSDASQEDSAANWLLICDN